MTLFRLTQSRNQALAGTKSVAVLARARQWMTAEPITVDAGSTRAAAARVMRAYDIHHIPLVQDDRPVGMLHVADEPSPRAPIGLRF